MNLRGEQLLVVPIDVLGHEGLDAARAATGRAIAGNGIMCQGDPDVS